MPAPLSAADIQLFEPSVANDMAETMIAGLWATVTLKVAPCLATLDWDLPANADKKEFVKLTLRGAILRWLERGSGAVRQRSAGDYAESLDVGIGLLQPAEIRDLQELCETVDGPTHKQRATTVPTMPAEEYPTVHPFIAPEG